MVRFGSRSMWLASVSSTDWTTDRNETPSSASRRRSVRALTRRLARRGLHVRHGLRSLREQVLPEALFLRELAREAIEVALRLLAQDQVELRMQVQMGAVEQGRREGDARGGLRESLHALEDARVLAMVGGPRVLELDGVAGALDPAKIRISRNKPAIANSALMRSERGDTRGEMKPDAAVSPRSRRVMFVPSLRSRPNWVQRPRASRERRRVGDERSEEIEGRLAVLRHPEAQGLVA